MALNKARMKQSDEEKMVSSLSHSLQRAWPSDKNMLGTARNETMDPRAQETKMMSGLLRKASMLCKPGGGVDPSHKALMKDLVLSNDKTIQTALDVSSAGNSAELNRYLALLSLERVNPEKSNETKVERRELIRQWQEKLQSLDKSNVTTASDAQLEHEKMMISKGLGSKRSRPGSMMRLTSFRDNNRVKVVEESNKTLAGNDIKNHAGANTNINGTSMAPPMNIMPNAFGQQLNQAQNYPQTLMNSQFVSPLTGLPHANPGANGSGFGETAFSNSPTTLQAGNMDMLNQMTLQSLMMNQNQLPTSPNFFPNANNMQFGMMSNEKMMEAIALQQKQQLAQMQLQQQFPMQQMQFANMGFKQAASFPMGNTSLTAAAAAVQAQAQEHFRQMNASNPSLVGLKTSLDNPASSGATGQIVAGMKSQDDEKEKLKLQRLMVRREKKSKRERQRRLVLNTLYDDLGSMLFDNNEHETKDRATILQTAIDYLNKSCNIPIPPSKPNEAEDELGLDDQCIYPDCPNQAMQGKDCCFEHGGGGKKSSNLTAEERLLRRRGKKSKREKQRRHNVNLLSERLGEMLGVTESKDKTTVLNAAIQFLRKHPRKKGERIGTSETNKTSNRSPASLKTGISFLRASQQ